MDAMEIDDNLYISKNLTADSLITKDFQRRKQPCRSGTVFLGLLCAVLLAGNIGQIIYQQTISHPASANPTQAGHEAQVDRLQSSYEALAAERKQLEARLDNLTKQKDQLEQSYSSLTAERDEFNVSLGKMKNEKDQLQASYNTSKQEGDRLQTRCDDLHRNLVGLQTSYNKLTASKDQLQTNYSDLQRENGELQTLFHHLQGNYSSLQRDMDRLQRSYNTLNISKNYLQISYNSLWKDKEQLQTSCNSLQREKEWLQTNYSTLAADIDQLEMQMDKVRTRLQCPIGWKKFDISCYFVSTTKKNWTLSRKDCISRGADLVVIDSRDEQQFIYKLIKPDKNAWIGLTDSLQEGTWMWVDGTPVTTTYWEPGQPNSYNGNQDCGEIVPKSSGVGQWNDDGCFADQIWICEK
uniref:C-type lectin domain family 4 member M-like isoform X2 n=1 Tax=Scatophagus argus TaxID=75038 RepID=UPI001ED83C8C|nr:C-type lectin domain family 4 member M-like isoform X2 [Scatophagus argus]